MRGARKLWLLTLTPAWVFAQHVLAPVASFDLNDFTQSTLTQAGFTALTAPDNTTATTGFSVSSASGVSLTVSQVSHANDRVRTAIAGLPDSNLLSDFTFTSSTASSPTANLRVDLQGLQPSTPYRLRVYSHDSGGNDSAVGVWTLGSATAINPTDAAFQLTHRNLSAQPLAGYFDIEAASDASGNLALLARAASSGIALFNGLEVLPVSSQTSSLARFDINDGSGLTAAGYTALLPVAGATETTGSATDSSGVSLTVASDRPTDALRHRASLPGEDVFEDFLFADNRLTLQISNLPLNRVYEVNVLSQDTDGNANQYSAWTVDGHAAPVRTAHYNVGTATSSRSGPKSEK